MSEPVLRRRYRLFGAVQGVGLRWRLRHAAETLGLAGWVRNEPDGSVTLELQGTEEQIDGVILAVERGTYVQIENLYSKTIPTVGDEYCFTVRDDE